MISKKSFANEGIKFSLARSTLSKYILVKKSQKTEEYSSFALIRREKINNPHADGSNVHQPFAEINT